MPERSSLRAVLIGAIVGSMVTAIVVGSVLGEPRVPKAPALAGQTVATDRLAIDFSKRYDLLVRPEERSPVETLESCMILGVTGRDKDCSSSDYSYPCYVAWLALELPDGRKRYVPKDTVLAFEESKVQAP